MKNKDKTPYIMKLFLNNTDNMHPLNTVNSFPTPSRVAAGMCPSVFIRAAGYSKSSETETEVHK